MALVPFFGHGGVPAPGGQDPESDPEDGVGAKMTFLEHLDELRKRIMVAVAAIGVACLISFGFVDRIYQFVMDPLSRLLPKGSTFIFTEPTEAFILYVKMALLAGIIIAIPVVMWQAWLFIAPGLYQKEKRLAFPFVFLASVGFIGGAAFTHYLLFPWMWTFFASFATDKLLFAPKIEPVFELYVKMILGMGLVFQMPAVIYFMARMGLVTARFLIKNFKYAILIIFIVAAVVTPSGDMLTQTLFAAPMIGLYLLSILIAWLFGKKRKSAPAEEEA
ncbi:MAG TPA: twin-arginine translocase subunit TatC [Vicinamibacterales bacterium]|jgi:sec-independent protein translocase protein TatC